MDRFQVPQFIETEVKIIGPFTLRQFLWIGIGGAIIFFAFLLFSITVFVIVFLVVGVASIALAFGKVNGVPLATYIGRAINYLLNPRQYKFKK